ncbi:MAG: type VI secretion system tip protein VgrG [Myxococcales bacterium]|nr:type VI secretion system tip protein VgrG [Myxococcales bacterium]
MLEHARVHFAARDMPVGRHFDVTAAETVDFDAPVFSYDVSFELSVAYALTIVFEHQDPNLELEPLLWRLAGLETRYHDQAPAYWQGVVESVRYVGRAERDRRDGRYEVVLRPALHRLRYSRDTRIFQHRSVPEIVGSVIGSSGQVVEWSLASSYPPLDYVVQRQESDLDFVARLLADEGIAYWFRHASDGHVMHLADGPQAYSALESPLRCTFSSIGDPYELTGLELTTRVVHDVHTSRDWNWQHPDNPLTAEHADGSARRFERYEYPGRFQTEADGARLARRRQEADSCRRWELRAQAWSPHLAPAETFTLVDATPDELNLDYLITAVSHRLDGVASADALGVPAITIRAGLASEVFRPTRALPRPRAGGRESAFVAGPAGEEIHVDAFGSVKTAFYWDRLGQRDHSSSTWVRTVQPNTVGSMFLPRIGWEVAVAHLDGDPDRPLVTHKLFNAEQLSTYPLPESLRQTSWQTSSSPGGGGSNELRFDDTLGVMELFVHAERDHHATVGHDREETVGANSTEHVRGQLQTSVGANESVTVGVDAATEVRHDMRLATGGAKTVSVAQLDAWNVYRNHTITVGGDCELTVVGPMIVVARAATQTLQQGRECVVGGALLRRSDGAFVEAVGGNKTESVGGARVALVGRVYSEQIEGSKTLRAGAGSLRTAGSISIGGQSLDFSITGSLTEDVVGTAGVSGASVVVRGDDELRATAGGAELVLGGDVLDLDASAFSSTASVVRLVGQIEVISPDSAEEAEPEEPSPEDDWIEVTLLDPNGQPRANEPYVLRLPDGTERTGRLDGSGYVREDGLPPGTVLISFPELDPSEEDEAADEDDSATTSEPEPTTDDRGDEP